MHHAGMEAARNIRPACTEGVWFTPMFSEPLCCTCSKVEVRANGTVKCLEIADMLTNSHSCRLYQREPGVEG